MKTVYTITAEQFKAINSFASTLLSDNAPLTAARRKSLGEALTWLVEVVEPTCTEQMEPADRKGWAGIDRRVVDRRDHDAGPIIRNVAAHIATPKGNEETPSIAMRSNTHTGAAPRQA